MKKNKTKVVKISSFSLSYPVSVLQKGGSVQNEAAGEQTDAVRSEMLEGREVGQLKVIIDVAGEHNEGEN